MLAAIKVLASRIRSAVSPRQIDQDFHTELDAHLDLLTDENVRRGMSPESARREACMRLGGVTQLSETNRELRGLPILETLAQDLRFAIRMLRKNPGFTAVAVLTLALGVGANTAIFSVVYATLLKPLPYPHSEQLYNVFQQTKEGANTGWSNANFEDLRRQSNVFTELAAVQAHQLTLTGHGEPFVVNTSVATAQLFSLFQVQPIAGRTFYPKDGKPGAAPVVVLSENLWRGAFGGDPRIIGTSINLDKQAFTVIGVAPSAFRFPQIAQADQIWIPLSADPLFGPWIPRRGGHWLQVIGRLKPEIPLPQVQANLDAVAAQLGLQFPAENSGWQARAAPLQGVIVGKVRSALLVLLGAVGLVLLIACANIANLLLARAASRAREIAVRATLGAARARIVRQLLSETAVLGLLGGVAGVALAYCGVRTLAVLLPPAIPQFNPIRVDYFVLAFALLLSLLASAGFGLAPALFAAKSDLQSSLREGGGRAGESGKTLHARNILAAGEMAVAMVLLVAAGLLLRSFNKLLDVNPGFNIQQMVKAEVALPRTQYSTPQQWLGFSDELLTRLHAEPGFQQSAVCIPAPLADGRVNLAFTIVGAPPLSDAESRIANYVSVSQEYFRVMGIPLLSGRAFDQRDALSSPQVALVSKALARIYFRDQDPIGREISFAFPPSPPVARQIVGVVGDVRDTSLGADPGPMIYVPYAQAPFPGAVIVAKSAVGMAGFTSAIRRTVWSLDKDLPVTDIAEMTQIVDASVSQERFRTGLLALFGLMALVLAATGIFGVISYSVSRRTNEIGIRVALGASPPQILTMVLRETLTLALLGLALGVPASLGASRLLGHMLFNVSANDPATLAAVALCLCAVALTAGYLPARRAVRVDPLRALRHE
jgi:putative ABC transport system permease protein